MTPRRAFGKVIDRLLSSPAYGERMAWDWMEVGRYSDSNGYQKDAERAMWPWRNWVIKAFNENLPYDQFTIWQLAGDLLPEASREQKLATAFLRNHPINGEGGRISEENRVDYVMDMAETTGTAWLGLTMNCTRCHDHKFDPLTKKDYFGLFAFFNQTPVTGGGGDPQTKPVLDFGEPAQKAQLEEFEARLTAAATNLDEAEKSHFPRDPGKKASESDAAEKFTKELKGILDQPARQRDNYKFGVMEKEFEGRLPGLLELIKAAKNARDSRDQFARTVPMVMVMEDMAKPRKTQILERGLYNQPGEEITAATPAQLPPMPANAPKNRLGLAQWIVAADNPLTARVTVNRIWQMFFGVGLVKTSEDFGSQGESPLHPELLDWLAADFRDSGWDTKRLIRTILTSSTYRQSSKISPELRERDPANRLLARGPRFRMPSWMLRDQALAVSGLLVERIGGPSVNPYQPEGVWEETTFGEKKYKQDQGEALYRRSLYIFWRRIIGPTVLFDTASRMTCNVKPIRNNTPLHAFTTLNDVTFVEAARTLAQRVMERESSNQGRAQEAFFLTLARKPDVDETKLLLSGFEKARDNFIAHPEEAKKLVAVGASKPRSSLEATDLAAWTTTCLTILNLDETLTKE